MRADHSILSDITGSRLVHVDAAADPLAVSELVSGCTSLIEQYQQLAGRGHTDTAMETSQLLSVSTI